jgi:hypothetical protein
MSLDRNTVCTKNVKNRNFFLTGRFLLQVLFSLSIFFILSSNSFAATSVGVSSKPALTNGLVGHWTFDGKNMTNTTVIDSSGNGRTGTLTNMTVISSKVVGKIGQGLRFDGTDDYVSIPYTGIDFERTQPITISAWVKLNSVAPVGGFQTVFGRIYGAGSSKGTFLGW